VKNQRNTIGTEEKLHVISRREKGEWIFYICSNVRLSYGCVHAIRDNANRIKEHAKSGTKVFVCVARLPQSEWTIPKTMNVSLLRFYCITNKLINMYIV
jgi:hypothetical protein